MFSVMWIPAISRAQQYQQNPSIHTLNLMPWPAHIQLGHNKFRLTHKFTINITGNPNKRIYGAVTRMLRRLDDRTGLFFEQDYITGKNQKPDASMNINIDRPGKIKIGENESYELDISTNKITLNAEDDIGALHGLQTFLQLVMADAEGFYVPTVKIKDHPRFQWRGLLIDVARHFMPIPVLERNIDAMASVKLNVLHLHLSDDQGFRVQCKTFPKLTADGSDGLFYTQDQIKRLIKYAHDRGIMIVPEFDLPSHSTSWFVGYPQYASAPGPYTIQRKYGVFNPVFNPIIKKTYTFLDAFFKEMSHLFPGPFMHIGGDENTGVDWSGNKEIRIFMKKHHFKTTSELQTYFVQRLSKIITKYGKRMIGWDEILQPGIPESAVIQSWRGNDSFYKALKEGHDAILSRGYYIDLMQSAAHYYKKDPLPPDNSLTSVEKKRVLGGEATMWGELVTPKTIDSRIWPRTAAIAERLWSPDTVQSIKSMYRRIRIVNLHLEDLGITSIKNQGMLLRQLAGSYDIKPLKVLVDVISPLKGYKRNKNGKFYTSYSPFTMIADAATADPESARKFNGLVKNYVQHPSKNVQGKINRWLTYWTNNNPELQKIIDHAPALDRVKNLAGNLNEISLIGLQALRYYNHRQQPDTKWINLARKVLREARKPYGKTKLRIVNSIEQLVNLSINQGK